MQKRRELWEEEERDREYGSGSSEGSRERRRPPQRTMETHMFTVPVQARGRRESRELDLRWNSMGIVLCIVAMALLLFALAWFILHAGDAGEEKEVPEPESYGDIVLQEDIQEEFLTVNSWSRPGDALEAVNGIVIHYVGNPGTSAMANRNYFESLASGADNTYASSHFIVGLDGEIIQCIPLTEIAYASNKRNRDTIAIEVCHPDADGQFSQVTYRSLVSLTADLCQTFHLDPETEVIRHYDVSGKSCPLYYVEHPEAWDQFRSDVADAMAAMES